MGYSETWTSANDATFQGKCWAALWDVCNRVLAEETGFPATGQESSGDDIVYAKKVLRDEQKITGRQLAQQVLRNTTIAGNIAGADDNDIQYQINSTWATFRNIG